MVASPTTRAQAWSAPELLVLGVRSCCCKPGLRHSLRRGGGAEGKLAGYPVWKRAERVLHSKYTVNVSAQVGRGEASSGEQRTLGKRTQRGIRFRRFLTDVRSTAKRHNGGQMNALRYTRQSMHSFWAHEAGTSWLPHVYPVSTTGTNSRCMVAASDFTRRPRKKENCRIHGSGITRTTYTAAQQDELSYLPFGNTEIGTMALGSEGSRWML